MSVREYVEKRYKFGREHEIKESGWYLNGKRQGFHYFYNRRKEEKITKLYKHGVLIRILD